MELKPYSIFSVVCLSCALITGGFGVARNQASTNANSARNEALKQITNYRIAQSCWELETNTPLTIGTRIKLSGKSPTQCFYDPLNGTYAYAGYLKGRLQVLYTFTETEVNKGVNDD